MDRYRIPEEGIKRSKIQKNNVGINRWKQMEKWINAAKLWYAQEGG